MEATIMAPILNFYGTFPSDRRADKRWNGGKRWETSRLNYCEIWKMLLGSGHKYCWLKWLVAATTAQRRGEKSHFAKRFVREISQLWKFQKCLYFIVFLLFIFASLCMAVENERKKKRKGLSRVLSSNAHTSKHISHSVPEGDCVFNAVKNVCKICDRRTEGKLLFRTTRWFGRKLSEKFSAGVENFKTKWESLY